MKKGERITPFLRFVGFLVLVTGVVLLAFVIRERSSRPSSPIEYIAVRSESSFSLPRDLLQYLLCLSSHEKRDLSLLDVHAVEDRVLRCPALEKVQIRRLFPNTLVVDYALKKPVFQVGSASDLLVDKEGSVFRRSPYFPFLSLPFLSFSHSEARTSLVQAIGNNKVLFSCCVALSSAFQELGFSVDEIDAEDALALGFFRREIRLTASRNAKTISVRLPVQEPVKLMRRVSLILERFPEYSGEIDLRFPDVAYLENSESVNGPLVSFRETDAV